MHFYLNYRGSLPSNGSPKQKHVLRQHFHDQLKELWNHKPLNEYVAYIGHKAVQEASVRHDDGFSVIEAMGNNFFAPLVTDKLDLLCELDITMLRPEEPGRVISGGDIDNRLKTLFDALSMPSHPNQIPAGFASNDASDPTFCLLKDDNLVSSVTVRCDRLLDPKVPNEVVLLIHASVHVTRTTFGNLGLGS